MLTPEQTVDAINRRFGRHAGVRALHAKGIVLGGTFTATAEAGRLTRAAHMQGQPVDVTVRFSNGSGHPRSRDDDPDVRGMAVAFHLPDGARTDISAQTSPRFPVHSHDDFAALVLATAPGVRALWRLPLFLARRPRVLGRLRGNAHALRPPPSYASRPYYAIHAFKWVAGDGVARHVRYRWLPEADEPDISKEEAKRRGHDYLHDEIRARVADGPIRYALDLQIAADGDPVDDPTAEWPDEREHVTAGTLEVTHLGGEEGLVYDPMRLTDGIEPSADPILNFRPRAYSVSAERRSR